MKNFQFLNSSSNSFPSLTNQPENTGNEMEPIEETISAPSIQNIQENQDISKSSNLQSNGEHDTDIQPKLGTNGVQSVNITESSHPGSQPANLHVNQKNGTVIGNDTDTNKVLEPNDEENSTNFGNTYEVINNQLTNPENGAGSLNKVSGAGEDQHMLNEAEGKDLDKSQKVDFGEVTKSGDDLVESNDPQNGNFDSNTVNFHDNDQAKRGKDHNEQYSVSTIKTAGTGDVTTELSKNVSETMSGKQIINVPSYNDPIPIKNGINEEYFGPSSYSDSHNADNPRIKEYDNYEESENQITDKGYIQQQTDEIPKTDEIVNNINQTVSPNEREEKIEYVENEELAHDNPENRKSEKRNNGPCEEPQRENKQGRVVEEIDDEQMQEIDDIYGTDESDDKYTKDQQQNEIDKDQDQYSAKKIKNGENQNRDFEGKADDTTNKESQQAENQIAAEQSEVKTVKELIPEIPVTENHIEAVVQDQEAIDEIDEPRAPPPTPVEDFDQQSSQSEREVEHTDTLLEVPEVVDNKLINEQNEANSISSEQTNTDVSTEMPLKSEIEEIQHDLKDENTQNETTSNNIVEQNEENIATQKYDEPVTVPNQDIDQKAEKDENIENDNEDGSKEIKTEHPDDDEKAEQSLDETSVTIEKPLDASITQNTEDSKEEEILEQTDEQDDKETDDTKDDQTYNEEHELDEEYERKVREQEEKIKAEVKEVERIEEERIKKEEEKRRRRLEKRKKREEDEQRRIEEEEQRRLDEEEERRIDEEEERRIEEEERKIEEKRRKSPKRAQVKKTKAKPGKPMKRGHYEEPKEEPPPVKSEPPPPVVVKTKVTPPPPIVKKHNTITPIVKKYPVMSDFLNSDRKKPVASSVTSTTNVVPTTANVFLNDPPPVTTTVKQAPSIQTKVVHKVVTTTPTVKKYTVADQAINNGIAPSPASPITRRVAPAVQSHKELRAKLPDWQEQLAATFLMTPDITCTDQQIDMTDPKNIGPPGPEVDQITEETTRCICNSTHESEVMIQCDSCQKWLHEDCIRLLNSRESDPFICIFCQNDVSNAIKTYVRKKMEGFLPILQRMQNENYIQYNDYIQPNSVWTDLLEITKDIQEVLKLIPLFLPPPDPSQRRDYQSEYYK